MSDTQAPSPVLENLGLQIRDLIENILANSFILDFGVVQSVGTNANGVTTVSVQHSVQLNKLGTVMAPHVTNNVEVMWWSSAGLSTQGKIAAGDTVLLVGLKDYLSSIAKPNPSDQARDVVPIHYARANMKAIAMGPFQSGSTHTIDGSGSALVIDGGTQGAARNGDAVNASAAFLTYLGTLTPPWAGGAGIATIAAGSSKVKIG